MLPGDELLQLFWMDYYVKVHWYYYVTLRYVKISMNYLCNIYLRYDVIKMGLIDEPSEHPDKV